MRPEHRELDYWLERSAEIGPAPALDRPLLGPAEIAAHNRLLVRDPAGARGDLLVEIDRQALGEVVERRLRYLHGKLASGAYVTAEGAAAGDELLAAFAIPHRLPALHPELRVALAPIGVRCGPWSGGFYTPSLDLAFDRNLCSMIREQEPVQILMAWSEGLVLARTGYVLGWIAGDSVLSPPLTPAQARAFVAGPGSTARRDTALRGSAGQRVQLPFGARVPTVPGGRGEHWVATDRGVEAMVATDPDALAPSSRPLTRRQLLTDAFAYLDRPYGWGGYDGGRDCSRFLLDLFAGFGLDLPRHSSDQAVAGAVIELPEGLGEEARIAAIDRAHRQGAVLLHFPNHIMLYLGRDAHGVPMAIHSFAEYLVPCVGRTPEMAAGERETLLTVERVDVSDLELGRGSSRRSFIERITKITVVGRRPPEPPDNLAEGPGPGGQATK